MKKCQVRICSFSIISSVNYIWINLTPDFSWLLYIKDRMYGSIPTKYRLSILIVDFLFETVCRF